MDVTKELFCALKSGASYDKIKMLIDSGANIKHKNLSTGEYPLTIALVEKYPLDVVKMLYYIEMHPINIISAMKIANSSDEIAEYLLMKMDELVDGPTFMKEWKAFKWDALFWRKAAPIRGDFDYPSIVGTKWNVDTNFQAISRVFRSTTYMPESNWNTTTNFQAEARGVRLTAHWTQDKIDQVISRNPKSMSHM